MKKVLFTILTFICCCMLVITSLFSFNSINKAGAVETSQTYDYTGELDEDYSGFGDFAIDNIEYLLVNGGYIARFVLDNQTSSSMKLFNYRANSSVVLNQYSLGFCCNFVTSSGLNEYHFAFLQTGSFTSSMTDSEKGINAIRSNSGDTTYYLRPGFKCHVYFSNYKLSFGSKGDLVYSSDSSYKSVSNLFYSSQPEQGFPTIVDFSPLFDMSSDTSFNINLSVTPLNSGSISLLREYLNPNWSLDFFELSLNSIIVDSSSFYVLFGLDSLYSTDMSNFNTAITSYYYYHSLYYITSFNFDFTFEDFYFYIKKPVYRVNNTLLIYNFDYYDVVSNISYVRYQLSKDNDFYNVVYTGSLPNSKYIEIFSTEVNNITFDEYIYLYLEFSSAYNYSTVSMQNIYNDLFPQGSAIEVPLDFGFDFNFSYYTQPLVANNGSYASYKFSKPGYVDMPFSLYPFHIPVLEICENVMIFLVFYCPLISDILELIYFDRFFGALLQLFNFIFGSAIGSFVLGCLAFIIFWSLLKGLFPVFVSSGSRSYKEASDLYDAAIDLYNKPSRKGRLRPYRSKSSLGSSSRKRYSSFTKINSDKSKKMSPLRRHAKNFKFDNDISDDEI